MITVGGLSVAVSRRPSPEELPPADTALSRDLQNAARDTGPAIASVEPKGPRDSAQPKTSEQPRQAATAEKAQLSFGGGVSDLDDASIQALLGALDEIDRKPIAVSAEPDHSPVLPVIREGTR
jgi:hypothetical protein